jgi:hypothetical protein
MKDQHSIRGKAPQKGTPDFSRRDFLYGSAVGAASAAMLNPALAAAQSVGVKPGDLPDLTIKEVKVYVTDMTNIHRARWWVRALLICCQPWLRPAA